MKSKLHIIIILSVIFILAFTLNACKPAATQDGLQQAVDQTMTAISVPTSTPAGTAIPLPSATATTQPVAYGPDNFPANVNPLTGLTVADPTILDRRPVMVKVANFPREGRPQAGLSQADIVFDYSTGVGQNRFLALYYGQDSTQVGPIRSGRYIDGDLVSMYQGVLGLMYAEQAEMVYLHTVLGYPRVMNGSENTCPSICNLKIGISEINYFGNTAELTKRYNQEKDVLTTKPDLHGMAFNTIPAEGGVAGTDMTMHFGVMNESQWKYDPASKKYLGWIDNQLDAENFNMIPWVDRNNNQQLAFSNIVFIFADYNTLNPPIDTEHRVSIVGYTGKMMLFRDGQMYEGFWQGYSGYAPLKLMDANYNIIELQPGNTWVNITGTYSDVANDTPGVYKVTFKKP
jgi:hypothetical protein